MIVSKSLIFFALAVLSALLIFCGGKTNIAAANSSKLATTWTV